MDLFFVSCQLFDNKYNMKLYIRLYIVFLWLGCVHFANLH